MTASGPTKERLVEAILQGDPRAVAALLQSTNRQEFDPLSALDAAVDRGAKLSPAVANEFWEFGVDPSELFVMFQHDEHIASLAMGHPDFSASSVFHALMEEDPSAILGIGPIESFTNLLPQRDRDDLLMYLSQSPEPIPRPVAVAVIAGGASPDSLEGRYALLESLQRPNKRDLASALISNSRDLTSPIRAPGLDETVFSTPLLLALRCNARYIANEIVDRLDKPAITKIYEEILDPGIRATVFELAKRRFPDLPPPTSPALPPHQDDQFAFGAPSQSPAPSAPPPPLAFPDLPPPADAAAFGAPPLLAINPSPPSGDEIVHPSAPTQMVPLPERRPALEALQGGGAPATSFEPGALPPVLPPERKTRGLVGNLLNIFKGPDETAVPGVPGGPPPTATASEPPKTHKPPPTVRVEQMRAQIEQIKAHDVHIKPTPDPATKKKSSTLFSFIQDSIPSPLAHPENRESTTKFASAKRKEIAGHLQDRASRKLIERAFPQSSLAPATAPRPTTETAPAPAASKSSPDPALPPLLPTIAASPKPSTASSLPTSLPPLIPNEFAPRPEHGPAPAAPLPSDEPLFPRSLGAFSPHDANPPPHATESHPPSAATPHSHLPPLTLPARAVTPEIASTEHPVSRSEVPDARPFAPDASSFDELALPPGLPAAETHPAVAPAPLPVPPPEVIFESPLTLEAVNLPGSAEAPAPLDLPPLLASDSGPSFPPLLPREPAPPAAAHEAQRSGDGAMFDLLAQSAPPASEPVSSERPPPLPSELAAPTRELPPLLTPIAIEETPAELSQWDPSVAAASAQLPPLLNPHAASIAPSAPAAPELPPAPAIPQAPAPSEPPPSHSEGPSPASQAPDRFALAADPQASASESPKAKKSLRPPDRPAQVKSSPLSIRPL